MTSLFSRLRRLLPYFKESRGAWAIAAVASIFSAATEPLTAALMKPLLDKGFSANALPLWSIPMVIVGLFLLRGVAGFISQYAMAWAANKGVLNMRMGMFDHLMRASPTLFGSRTASSLTNTLVYEVQSGAQQLANGVNSLVRDTLVLIGLFGYLLWLNWQLTLMVSILFPAVAWTMQVIGRRLRHLSKATQSATDDLAYVVEENVLAWRIVRLHGAENVEAERFGSRSRVLRSLMMRSVAASATMTPVTQVLSAMALSSVITVALWQSSQGMSDQHTVGGFVSFITAMLMLITPIKHLSDVMAPITKGLTALERGLDLMEKVPAESGGGHQGHRARGDITLDDVTLLYRADQKAALDHMSLAVKAGETVALVGPSGAGKTTLVNLLPRFVQPDSGTIALDGTALPDWDLSTLRQQFALVSQDVVLFNDTIARNVALEPQPDMARVEKALRSANLHEFAMGLPEGMDSPVGHNGSQLSGGQRQRLAIARALYKDAPVLILDEATSALDAESEHAVQQALEVLMKGRTTLVIAHRLSTIQGADRIVVMNAGRVEEQGSHAELLAANGLYARLHAMQFRT